MIESESNVVRAGQLYLEEVMELVDNKVPLSGDEIAGLLTQIDLIYHQASLLRSKEQPALEFIPTLARLCDQRYVHQLADAGASGRAVRSIRARHARMYARGLQAVTESCERRMTSTRNAANGAGQWILSARMLARQMRVRWILWRLGMARIAFLRGLPVKVLPLLESLQLLLE